MRRRTTALLLGLLGSACGGSGTPAPVVAPPAPASVGTVSSPAPASSSASAVSDAAPATIAFVEDDYARALADARARHVPVFIDTWALWCHTCLSMKSYVFPDPALQRFASRFVWLSIDTERDGNAALIDRLGVKVLPTLYVLDPTTEKPVVAWPGSLTATELGDLLDDVEAAVAHADSGGEAAGDLLRGHQASATGKLDEAITAYRAALSAAPPGWARRPQAVDGLVTRLGDAKQTAACVTVAAEEAPKMPPGTALADVLRVAMGCVDDLPKAAPERARLASLASMGERVAMDASQPILADDRSDLYDYVLGALKDLGQKDEARRVATAWSAFLDDQASRAPSPEARAVFDAHRLLAYLALGQPERAIPMLEASAHDFPQDYDPPARMATAYLAMKRPDDALAAVQKALTLCTGPRKLRLWSVEADAFEAKGDKASAKKALGEALDYAKSATLTGGYPKYRDAIAKRLAKLH